MRHALKNVEEARDLCLAAVRCGMDLLINQPPAGAATDEYDCRLETAAYTCKLCDAALAAAVGILLLTIEKSA